MNLWDEISGKVRTVQSNGSNLLKKKEFSYSISITTNIWESVIKSAKQTCYHNQKGPADNETLQESLL